MSKYTKLERNGETFYHVIACLPGPFLLSQLPLRT
jgi:hypothetical protein